MSPAELALRATLAAALVRDAGRLALGHFRRPEGLGIEVKGPQDLVTAADREVEERLRAGLAGLFPGEAVLGEEQGGDDADALWVIDPIDGTANFARGIPYWSVVLAFALDGRPVVGVTYDPVHDELFVAWRDGPATRDGRAIEVSAADRSDSACIGLSYTFKLPRDAYVGVLGRALARGFDHRRLGSTALMLCHVADGRLDACVAPYCNSWDVIAGLLTVERAGGFATPFAPPGGLTAPSAVFGSAAGLREVLAEVTGITGGAALAGAYL